METRKHSSKNVFQCTFQWSPVVPIRCHKQDIFLSGAEVDWDSAGGLYTVRSHVQRWGPGPGAAGSGAKVGEGLYSEVQGMGNGQTRPAMDNRMTDMTFLQVCWRKFSINSGDRKVQSQMKGPVKDTPGIFTYLHWQPLCSDLLYEPSNSKFITMQLGTFGV